MTSNPLPPPSRVGLGRRLLAMLYDGLLLIAVLFAASAPLVVWLEITTEHPLYPVYVLYVYAVGFLFFGWFWTHGGQTLGMKTWGIRLERFDGSGVPWGQALGRYLAALVSWLPFGLGFLWSLIQPERLAWHDLWSRSRLRRVPRSGATAQ